MTSGGTGYTAQDPNWKSKEQAEEAQYIRQKEQEQLAALRESVKNSDKTAESSDPSATLDPNAAAGTKAEASVGTQQQKERDFEGGYGGMEDYEDRYATTYGAH
ncbi:hypothetical protein CONPUDRAFT_150248 [Coniophora puteana RWD-64-598 SS2]|uniref:ATPase inhibitor, mitochondrial n=1 Tax=Coniophora puteana (strain RWD-64-598) TaxID=741705 RepID=A0A5M3N2D9_CONPW|nr:uncharacterized protein CONPUDRAFT_150248 [Coniophora puteana RWD-64-598 SS2]EIW85437.1 hypothetical protein CONPUDRAFT_150248 [Coniophora puteana RWD-64-598 SS2]